MLLAPRLLAPASCLLPTAHWLLPTGYWLLPTPHCPLPTASCPLHPASCPLPIPSGTISPRTTAPYNLLFEREMANATLTPIPSHPTPPQSVSSPLTPAYSLPSQAHAACEREMAHVTFTPAINAKSRELVARSFPGGAAVRFGDWAQATIIQ